MEYKHYKKTQEEKVAGNKREAEELETATVWQVSHLRFDPAFLLC